MDVTITGTHLAIRFLENDKGDKAQDNWNKLGSWLEAAKHFKAEKADTIYVQMHIKMKRMSDGNRLRNPIHFNKEGDLPNGKKFYAIKQDKVRAYGWYSDSEKGVFIISHFAYKNRQQLSDKDKKKVVANWKRVERGE